MLAIVIPYYKLTFFEDTLHSLSKQTNKNFRVYIGNDNSPEDPINLILKYQNVLNITYKVFEKNLGSISLTSQWERCIEMINDEEWLTILGDDDYYSEDIVENFYISAEIQNREQPNLIRFPSQLVDDHSKIISEIFYHPEFESATTSFMRRFKGETRSSLSEYFFKRKVYEKFSFKHFSLGWHSDDLAWIEFSDNQPIQTINKSIVNIRCSTLNISGQSDLWPIKNFSSREFYEKLIKNHFNQFARQDQTAILERYIFLLFHTQILKHQNLLRLTNIALRYPRKKVLLVALGNIWKRLKK